MQLAVSTVEAAWQLFAGGRFTEASDIAHRILAREPDNVAAMCCAAVADWELGRDIDPCIAALERAAELAPREGSIRHNLATLLASRGDMARACASFEAALAIRPEDTRAFYGLAQNSRFTEETPMVRQMLALYGTGTLDRASLEFLCFGLAKVYADIGNHSRAMHFCIEANWLAARQFDMAGERQRLGRIRQLAAEGGLPVARGSQPGAAPLFIVGMPRSGTTLVEAILSRHPAVLALGESARLQTLDLELTGGNPALLAGLVRHRTRAAAEQALRDMRANATPATRIVADKTPENAFRLGLVAALFPDAKVIHVRRHPLDCGLSNLFTRFTAGQGFAFRQNDLGERIRQTAEVMSIWKKTLPLPILDVSYEQLVADSENQSRRMVAFLGLDWDPACLSPEQARRQQQTASQWQVRQKIHANSVGRFRAYEEWLGPLVAAMGGHDWIAAEAEDQLRQ